MDANRPVPGPGGYGGLGAGSIVSKNIQPLLEADPRQIGPYAVRGRLGQGAMGSVYLGFAPTGQAFALKVLRQDFASDRDFRKRFTREIAAARAVHSPFVNAVTDADPNAATPWLASYFIPGPPLSSAVQLAGPFSPRSVAHLGVGIGLALQAIHTAGIVHRDLKPANVLVASDGPRVIDFGIARAVDASMLTATGMRLGTPSFMAPEQVAGTSVEAPADVWAVGGMLIYAATGRTAFGDGNAMAILYRVENHDPDLEGLEPALAHIAAKCLAKDPAERPTPTQLVEMCRAALSGGLAGHPALRGSDVTGWLPSAVSRDLAARAVELANIGQVVPAPVPAPPAAAGGVGGASATGTGMSTGGGKTGGLGGFLRRKGGGPANSAPATGTGMPHVGHPGDQYSQGAAMSGGQGQYGQPGGQTGGGQYGPPPGQGPQGQEPGGQYGPQGGFGGQEPGGTGGQYGAPGPQYGGAGVGGQFGQQPGGGQFGQQPPATPGAQQQGGFGAPQPNAPAWGPSGPSGSDMPTTIIPPNDPAPEPQGPAWRMAASSQPPTPPEPEPAGIAGLPAGFTPIGEEAKRLAEPAATSTPESGSSQSPASSSDQPDASSSPQAPSTPESSTPEFSAASDVDAASGPPKPSVPGIPQIAEPTFATNFNIPAVKPQPEADAGPAPTPSFGIPQIAEPTFATNFNIPVVTATPPDDAAESDSASTPPASSEVSVPSIAPPTFATNFNIPVVTPTPELEADRSDEPEATLSAQAATPTPAPAPAPSIGIPQIAEPTFATNFNIPVVTTTPDPDAERSDEPQATPSAPAPSVAIPQIAEPTFATNFNIPVVTAASSDTPEDEDPAPASSGISIPQIAEPTFATNFNIPVVTADPNAETVDGDAPAGTPAVSIPSIAEPSWATGFMPAVKPEPSAQEDAPAPTPLDPDPAPKPVTHAPPIPPHLQQPMTPPKGFGGPATAPNSQQTSQPQQPAGQQAQAPFAPPQQQSPFAPPQGRPQHGGYQQQGYQQQPQPPYAQQAPAPQQQFGAYQQPFAPPQQAAQQPFAPPLPQVAQQPGAQWQPGQQYQPPPQQPFAPPQSQATQHPGAQWQPGQQPRQDHIPQSGGMTIVPLPPSMESPYGVPERPHGPGPTLVDTGAATGWSTWSSSKRITVLAVAAIVVIGGIVAAILALSGGSSSESGASSQSPTTAAADGPIGAQQGAPGARDVVLRGLYVAAANRDFQTVCSSQTVAAQKGAAKGAGWNGQGDPMPSCEKYFQANWSTINADYLRGRQVTDVKAGPTATTMTVTVNDPPPSGGGSTRSFTVVWQDTHWLLEAANA